MKYLCPFHSFYWTTLFRGNQVLDLSISHLEVSCISARWNRKLIYTVYNIYHTPEGHNIKQCEAPVLSSQLHNLMAMVTTSFHVNVSPQKSWQSILRSLNWTIWTQLRLFNWLIRDWLSLLFRSFGLFLLEQSEQGFQQIATWSRTASLYQVLRTSFPVKPTMQM